MYYKVDEKESAILNKITKITFTDYEPQGDFIEVESLMTALEDLLVCYEGLEEKYEDLQKDVEENYERIPADEYFYGVSDRDFM